MWQQRPGGEGTCEHDSTQGVQALADRWRQQALSLSVALIPEFG